MFKRFGTVWSHTPINSSLLFQVGSEEHSRKKLEALLIKLIIPEGTLQELPFFSRDHAISHDQLSNDLRLVLRNLAIVGQTFFDGFLQGFYAHGLTSLTAQLR